MTLEEAQKVAKILEMADGNCYSCVAELADEAQKVFPEFEWTTRKIMSSGSGWVGEIAVGMTVDVKARAA